MTGGGGAACHCFRLVAAVAAEHRASARPVRLAVFWAAVNSQAEDAAKTGTHEEPRRRRTGSASLIMRRWNPRPQARGANASVDRRISH